MSAPTVVAQVLRDALANYSTIGAHETARQSLLACIGDDLQISDLIPPLRVNMQDDLVAALREILAINTEDAGTFRKRGGTRQGLSIVAARAALAKVGM